METYRRDETVKKNGHLLSGGLCKLANGIKLVKALWDVTATGRPKDQ